MKICVFGAGGLGGFFGGWLAASGQDVTFVARGKHLAAMQSGGLEIRSELGNRRLSSVNAVDDPASVGLVDVLLFTVKTFDLTEGAKKCHSLVRPDTLVVSMLNGVEWVEQLKNMFGEQHLAAGITVVPSNIVSPGVIGHKGLGTAVTLGAFDEAATGSLKAFRDAMRAAGIDARIDNDIEVTLWTKFIGWSAGAGVTGLSRQPFGELQRDAALKETLMAAMTEAEAVTRGSGIGISHNVVSEMMAVVQSLPPDAKSSMLVDLENGKRLELEAGTGAVVRLGHQLGIETPVSSTICAALGPFVNGR